MQRPISVQTVLQFKKWLRRVQQWNLLSVECSLRITQAKPWRHQTGIWGVKDTDRDSKGNGDYFCSLTAKDSTNKRGGRLEKFTVKEYNCL